MNKEKSPFYGRDGQSLPSALEWGHERENNYRVAETTLANGTWISTVYVGIALNVVHGRPLIFETMVFPSKTELSELDCKRYATEDQALAGHAAMVKRWTRRKDPRP